MTPLRPSLADLRVRVHKDRSGEIGNWLARRIVRPAAIPGTWLAIRLGLGAHHVTALALATALAGAGALGTGQRLGFVIGSALALLAFWLDHVDGQVARWRGTASLDGVYFDYLMHHAWSAALGFAAGYGLAVRTGVVGYALAGFSAAAGWVFLGLHNDCRYKAFFQRLKSTQASYRVDGGAGGRTMPPAAWPRRGWGVVSWPAYKICEPHMVLLEVTALAALAVAWPAAWMRAWPVWVVLHALMAPALAALRAARSIRAGSVEAEFARWFRPPGLPASAWTVDPGTSMTRDAGFGSWNRDHSGPGLEPAGAWTIHDERRDRQPGPLPASSGRS